MNPQHIIIHHSLTADSGTVSWGAIRRYHTEERGWKDIGYHYGIELVGDRYEILLGRMPNMIGAHTIGMNHNSVGICCVGNYDIIPPPELLLDRLITLCRFLMGQYAIPATRIQGHRFYAEHKSCPGTLFDMEKLRGLLL